MKRSKQFLALVILLSSLRELVAQTPPFDAGAKLNMRQNNSNFEISWPAQAILKDTSTSFPIFEIQRSADLTLWQPVGERQRGSQTLPTLKFILPPPEPRSHFFYRVMAIQPSPTPKLASGGAEVFGYATAFAQALTNIGQITPDQFATRFPAPTNYLPALAWDPTAADYWPKFNVDPEAYNADLIPFIDDLRQFDFRLSPAELTVFKQNGFVVSERLGAPSCGELFSRLWKDKLPVFISADTVLHAWHRSYDMMLSELEETFLFENVHQMLEGMNSEVINAAAEAGSGPLKNSVLDADYLLTVARSLLLGSPQLSSLNQDTRVATTLTAITNLTLDNCFNLFGQPRVVDFSQFKPRGHYTESEQLGRYFRCVMWLGRTELRIAGGPYQDSPCAPSPQMAPPRELGAAIVLNDLVNRSGQFDRWQQFDRLIETFVGWTDSMTFAQAGAIFRAAGIQHLSDVATEATLASLQAQILNGDIGVQNIRSDWFRSPLGPEQIQLPRAFTMFGQKFIMDSWALDQVVFDNILWDNVKVPRRVPSGLDVAFGVFGNNQIVPEIVARIQDHGTNRNIFRDGMFYQHNLAAVRAVVESHPASSWNQNLYMGWLATLRELSNPLTDAIYPDAVRTHAWAMKDLNTQLTSWTQLRHDTILYAQQSETGGGEACSYPKGYVEPRPAFWKRLTEMAQTAANLIGTSDYSGTIRLEYPANSGIVIQTNLATLQNRQAAFFQRFAEVAGTLLDMSDRELRQVPFTQAEEAFLQDTMFAQLYVGYFVRGWNVYDGWYPKLFYRKLSLEPSPILPAIPASQAEGDFQLAWGALRWDGIITDVHTDLPCGVEACDPADPGSVLNEGIGRAQLLMIAINSGIDRCVYAGPVLSHYEFELGGPPQRLSDEDWRGLWQNAGFGAWSQQLDSDNDFSPSRDWSGIPPQPDWTRGYLVPLKR